MRALPTRTAPLNDADEESEATAGAAMAELQMAEPTAMLFESAPAPAQAADDAGEDQADMLPDEELSAEENGIMAAPTIAAAEGFQQQSAPPLNIILGFAVIGLGLGLLAVALATLWWRRRLRL
jgi:hypothetical protein